MANIIADQSLEFAVQSAFMVLFGNTENPKLWRPLVQIRVVVDLCYRQVVDRKANAVMQIQ